jgi:VWFA-related protein
MTTPRANTRFLGYLGLKLLWLVFFTMAVAPFVFAQSSSQTAAPQSPQTDQAAPAAGGPGGDNGAIALPKKKDNPDETPAPAPAEPRIKNPEGLSNLSLHVEVPEVTVDVGVMLEKTRQFVPNLRPGNFRVYEDGVPQKIEGFKRTEAPITALLLCEFASNSYYFIYDMRNAAWTFAQQLRPNDYVALMTFDMRTQIVTDFTQDKKQILEGINMLQIPGFHETNVFDALHEALDRLSRLDGQKYIVLISSGRDSFSRITFDQALKYVKASHNTTIYTVSTGGAIRTMTEGRGGMMSSMRDMDYLQADNEMKTFASVTGGMSFFPRFINDNIRSKYRLIYRPTNTKQDGSWRKIRVELVDDEGQPLRMQDEKHKPLKYQIIARDGYRARQEVE